MKTNTLLLVAAAAAVLYVLTKGNPFHKAAAPGAPGALQPPGAPSTVVQTTSGPTGTSATLVQQLGGAPGIADGVGKLASSIWDKLASSDDSDSDSASDDSGVAQSDPTAGADYT